MTHSYRIQRVQDADPVIDLRSMLRSALGMGPAPRPAPLPEPLPKGCVCFTAIAGDRMVGGITLHKPDRPAHGDSAAIVRLDADADHEPLGCREALLDVAQQWAQANEYTALEVVVPAAAAGAVEFYLANGFHIADDVRGMGIVMRLELAGARPHTDAWHSKLHGAWFASVAPR